MQIELTCPSCDRRLRVTDDLLGRLVRCPSCSHTFTATESGGGQAAARRGREIDREEEPYDDPPRSRDRSEPRRDRYDDDEPDEPRRRRRDRDWDEEDEPRRRPVRREDARANVAGPAVSLMVIGVLGIIMALLGMVVNVLVLAADAGPPRPEEERIGNLVGSIIGGIVGLIWSSLILLGAIKMKNLQSYGLAMTASIVAMVPCSACCLFGLPIGIWGLIVLNNPDVREAFR